MDAKKKVHRKPINKDKQNALGGFCVYLAFVPLLFVRIEFVFRKAKGMETKFENRIQQIYDNFHEKVHRIVMEMSQSNELPTTRNSKERNDVFGI